MRWAITSAVGFLLGALLALGEGIAVLVTSRLGFVSATAELFAMELRYGLVLAVVALLLALVLRRRSAAAVAALAFGFGLAIVLGWWVNKEILDGVRIWEPVSLLASGGVVVVSAALALLVAWLARRFARASAIALAAVLLAVPCFTRSGIASAAPAQPRDASSRSKPDVTLIIIDTLRADRLSCYGNPRLTSPNLDALAARGTRFEQCMTQSPWTRPSMASLHSGVYPSSHGCTDLRKVLPESAWTIAEALHAQGYETGGFSANAGLSPGYGFAQGFDAFWNTDLQELARFTMYGRLRHKFMKRFLHVNPDNFYSDAETLTDQAIRWLGERRGAPTFTYVHYLDPHWPYEPAEFLIDGEKPPVYDYVQRLSVQSDFPFDLVPQMPREAIAAEETYYEAEIRYCDRSIGRLLDHLKRIGKLEPNDVVIVASDHGEQFYEHGSWGHGTSLFHEELRVPLLIAGGGVPAGRVVTQPVQLIDVYSTILELAGAPLPPDSPARSLRPLLAGEEGDTERFVFSERLAGSWPGKTVPGMDAPYLWQSRTSLLIGHRKLIEMEDPERAGESFYMTFDLQENPDERLRVRPPAPGQRLDRSDPAFTADPALLKVMKRLQTDARDHSMLPSPENASREIEKVLDAIGYGK
jgi:arylsulfatase A-like enzyme